jgi:hypothetical protein
MATVGMEEGIGSDQEKGFEPCTIADLVDKYPERRVEFSFRVAGKLARRLCVNCVANARRVEQPRRLHERHRDFYAIFYAVEPIRIFPIKPLYWPPMHADPEMLAEINR